MGIVKKDFLKRFVKEWQNKEPSRKVMFACGWLALSLAIVGIFVPILPQIPFAVLAAFLFSKSSRRMHQWVRENKHFGRAVRDWEDDRVVRTKLKVFSLIAMLGGAGVGHWKLEGVWPWVMDAGFLASIVFVLTRKSHKKRKASH